MKSEVLLRYVGRWLVPAVAFTAGCAPETPGGPTEPEAALVTEAPVTIAADYSNCNSFTTPIWFAYKDGERPWTTVPITGRTFTFSIAGNRGAFASVAEATFFPGFSFRNVRIVYFTRADLERDFRRGVFGPCATTTTTGRTLHAALANTQALRGHATLLPTGGGVFQPFSSTVDLSNVSGTVGDFFAQINALSGIPSRFFLKRAVDFSAIPAGGSLPFVVDFAGAESFAPFVMQGTIGGIGTETVFTESFYWADCGRRKSFVLANTAEVPVGGAIHLYGLPPALLGPEEQYYLEVLAIGSDGIRQAARIFRPGASPSIALPPVLQPVKITELAGPYLRLQFSQVLPFSRASFGVQLSIPNSTNVLTLGSSPGYAIGSKVTIAVPDLSGLPGWQNDWVPVPTTSTATVNAFVSPANVYFGSGEYCSERVGTGSSGTWVRGNPIVARRVGGQTAAEAAFERAGGSDRMLFRR